jgi:acetyl esterase/lipase
MNCARHAALRTSWRALLCGIAFCSTALVADAEDAHPDKVVIRRNLSYREGDSPSWRLDLALPGTQTGGLRPAIVVIHGGGWLEGSRTSFSTVANRPPGNILDLAQRGFVAATIDYRLSGEATYPAALDDCRCAVRWLRAHSAEYGIDPERIGAWGNSAGGHLSLMLGLAAEPALSEGAPFREHSSRVQAVVSDSGPIDLVHQFHHQQVHTAIERFLGGPPDEGRLTAYRAASPSSYVKADVPPLLLIYGAADAQVGVETADRLVVDLAQAGHSDVSYLRLAATGHCPHSLLRLPSVDAAVHEFWLRTLMGRRAARQ